MSPKLEKSLCYIGAVVLFGLDAAFLSHTPAHEPIVMLASFLMGLPIPNAQGRQK
jgi:hypothetical protein